MKKIPGKDEAMGAVETLVRYIEKIDGDLDHGGQIIKHISLHNFISKRKQAW